MIPGFLVPFQTGDGNDGLTKILLHMEGANGGTAFTDSNAGGLPHTWTPTNATTSTAAFIFGTSALLAASGYIQTPNSADFAFGASDFTIDLWVNRNGSSGTSFLFGQTGATPSAANGSVYGYFNAADKLLFSTSDGSTISTLVSTTTMSSSGWHHIAFVRDGGTKEIYFDGTIDATTQAISGSINNSTEVFGVGSIGAGVSSPFSGYIDEFRLSVGVARWTSNFTPPVLAYGPG